MTLEDFIKLEADDILRLPFIYVYGEDKRVEVKPLTVGKVIEINPYLTALGRENLKAMREAAESNYFEEMPGLIEKYLEPISKIIKAVTGTDINEMQFRDIFIILMSIVTRMGIKSFQMSIIAGNALSRNHEQEIIACSHQLNSLL